MSLTSAFSNAASGLFATAKAAQTVSSNVSNALTESYGPRALALASAGIGGVRVAAVTRQVDPGLLMLNRQANAQTDAATTKLAYLSALESDFGTSNTGLQAAVAAFQNSLVSASARPDLTQRLDRVVADAAAVADAFAAFESAIQNSRAEADRAIASDVATLNTGLARVDALNEKIVAHRAAGQDTLALEDQRQETVSQLSQIVPLRELSRSDGRITLYTEQGQLVLDLNPAQITFTGVPDVDATMTLGNGLSGIAINGRAVSFSNAGPLSGGRLAEHMDWRDDHAVTAQAQLDALAHDLVQRFSGSGVDPTLAASDAGIFTDAGTAVGGMATPGQAGRMTVNPALDGMSWRIRDGLGAAAPTPSANPDQITRLAATAQNTRVVGASGLDGSMTAQIAALGGTIALQTQRAEDRQISALARSQSLNEQQQARGVDTDAQMQRLLVIEQNYAANARVIETADAMLRRLLEI